MKKIVIIVFVYAAFIPYGVAEKLSQEKIAFTGIAELGALIPTFHEIQFSNNGTNFDYLEQGGQNNVFPYARLSMEITFRNAHTLVFLYQPLNLKSTNVITEDFIADDQTFPALTPMDFRYGFDFYRASYLYDLLSNEEHTECSIGGSLQIRNATIDFRSGDGELQRSNRDIGPVPTFKVRYIKKIAKWWFGGEADFMYAPIKYINGSNSDVVGAIWDVSMRVGAPVSEQMDLFLNLRSIGGGAEGTSKETNELGDGYVKNWLHFMSLSIGLQWSNT